MASDGWHLAVHETELEAEHYRLALERIRDYKFSWIPGQHAYSQLEEHYKTLKKIAADVLKDVAGTEYGRSS